jgi:cysteine desulfurase/selenocysteine lyase
VAFCVDAIQGLGVFPHDVQKMNIDFLVSDGHKWMLGPEGLALFYCSAAWRERLELYQYGWHMLENAGNYDLRDWSVTTTAERFECGSPNMLGIHALSASMELILEYGVPQIEKDVLENSRVLFELICNRPDLDCISEQQEGRFAGIVTFRSRVLDSTALYRHLMNERIICANRGGGIRYSPHFYTPREKLEEAIDRVPSS